MREIVLGKLRMVDEIPDVSGTLIWGCGEPRAVYFIKRTRRAILVP